MEALFVGVDVGTGSARAAVFDRVGKLLGVARSPIRLWQDEGSIVEHSSRDIWNAVVLAVREAVSRSGVDPAAVRGIGFDATCSLVVVGRDGGALAVGPSEDPDRDVICWMDHRAIAESDRITKDGHDVLRFVGGAISPEMQTPKLRWLKRHRPETFKAAEHFFDLADYLSFRATGSVQRSVCTLTCKWTYLAHERRWDADYFRRIGLGELADEGFRRIGTEIEDVATPLGKGLTADAAAAFGLREGISVGASLIDAHAGALGSLDATGGGELALIMGTSACVMALTDGPVFVPGVWGPYHRALLPDRWLLEGGHSAYGAALDYLVSLHPAFSAAREAAAAEGISVLELLERRAIDLAGSIENAAHLAARIHIVPDLLGNRSPDADPHATAILSGLKLETSAESLVRLFVATLCALSYGTRDIVEAQRARGIRLGSIVASGGASRSPLMRHILADATRLRVRLPETAEPVLLGSAMVGAVASGAYPSLAEAMAAMGRTGEETVPNPALADFHAAKHEAYRVLQRSERAVRAIRIEETVSRPPTG